jgi:hypothetical protein
MMHQTEYRLLLGERVSSAGRFCFSGRVKKYEKYASDEKKRALFFF